MTYYYKKVFGFIRGSFRLRYRTVSQTAISCNTVSKSTLPHIVFFTEIHFNFQLAQFHAAESNTKKLL